jgi:hypothetical protein
MYRIGGDVRWIIGGLTILTSWPYDYYVLEHLAVRHST